MTASRDLAARVEALLAAEASMTPGPWRAGSFETFNIFVPCDDALAPELGRVLLRMNVHFPFVDDAAGIVALRNDAPAVIRDLIARLADQAPGLTVGAPEIERIILDDPLSEIDAAAEELDPGHILRVNREQRVEIARMRAEIARMRGMLASNRRDFTDGWVACAEYRGVDIDHDALERALDAELAPAERGPR